jgi:leucyl aminopeptidase
VDITVSNQDVTKVKTEALLVNLFEGVKQPGGATGAIDRALGGAISKLIESGEIKGKRGELTTVHVFGQIPAARVIVLGLGKREDFTADGIRRGIAEASRAIRGMGVKRYATILHGGGIAGLEPQACAQAIAEGAILGLYTFKKLGKPPSDSPQVQGIEVVEGDKTKLPAIKRGIEAGMAIAESVCLARDMANMPANKMTPTDIAAQAQKAAKETGLAITIFGRKEMEKMGMGAILGVSQGSAQPPKFIVLKYMGDKANPKKVIGLVGKGVSFDTGGISLKPADGMGWMKTDMSGAATVIAAIRAIALLKPKVNVVALAPCAENMPSGTAQKPGDVLSVMNGKTVEVDNTDAEGRLLLADALSYGNQLGLSPMIDVATLTGAIKTTFGGITTGVFTNHQPTCDRLLKAAATAGEKAWQLPMHDEYKEQNKSDVADIKNSGGAGAGSITAALFLAEFAGKTPWVHLDIAGTGRTDSTKGYITKGSTGIPARTLVQFVLDSAS